jgi:hypothetical protein
MGNDQFFKEGFMTAAAKNIRLTEMMGAIYADSQHQWK